MENRIAVAPPSPLPLGRGESPGDLYENSVSCGLQPVTTVLG
jgi:hypothetical protein